jgi:hypothetical protein
MSYLYNKQVLVAWLVGLLVCDHLLLRDSEPYGLVFMSVFCCLFAVYLTTLFQ